LREAAFFNNVRFPDNPLPGTFFGNPPVPVTVRAGQTLLIRLLVASYNTARFTIPLDAQVVSIDGRGLGRAPGSVYSRPFRIRAGQSFELTTGRRFSLTIRLR
jgi:hypothetical protein